MWDCYLGGTSRKEAEETFRGITRKCFSMVRQTDSLRRSLLGRRSDFPLMSHVLLNWTKQSTTFKRGGLVMAVRFVGLEGVLAADADIHSASLIVYHRKSSRPSALSSWNAFTEAKGINPRSWRYFCFHEWIWGSQADRTTSHWRLHG